MTPLSTPGLPPCSFRLALCIALLTGAQGVAPFNKVAATDAQQRALELTAAQAVGPMVRDAVDVRITALDARVYTASYDRVVDRKADDAPWQASTRTESHTEAHLKDLVTVLGVAAVVDDKSATCISEWPAPCRIGAYKGLLAFSPAMVKGDSGYIALKLAVPSHGSLGLPVIVSVDVWSAVLLRQAGVWKVLKIQRIAVN